MMQSVVLRIVVWLFAEVVLTALGTDDMADYSEYIFKAGSLLAPEQLASSEYVCTNGICRLKDSPAAQGILGSTNRDRASADGVTSLLLE